jgi:WD40 repeat protein
MRRFGAALLLILAMGSGVAYAQGAPDVVWQVPTPNGVANRVTAVAFTETGDSLVVGSSDRFLRARNAESGAQLYAVLEPHRSGGVVRVLSSSDGAFIGVQNADDTMGFRVQRSADGAFVGNVVGSVGANGIVTFAPDSTLLANTGGDGTLSLWGFSDLTVSRTTGSGHAKVTTTFNFSRDGRFQTSASMGAVTLQRRSDGSAVKMFSGGPVVTFSPNSEILAVFSETPNEIVLYSTFSLARLVTLKTPEHADGVTALRFTPDGAQLVSTGYVPYVAHGIWQQAGTIRFWRVTDGALLRTYDQRTGTAVTSPVAWSPDATRFAYGLYDGTAAVARTPP